VFDTYGPLAALRRVRDRVNADELTASRIYCAGNIIGTGGPWSPDMGGMYASLSPAVVQAINDEWVHGVGEDLPWLAAEDVRAPVREYIAASGIDFVKYASSAHSQAKFLAFSPAAQRVIVEEAHLAAMTAQACTQAPEPLRVAIDAGVDLLQHGDLTGLHPMPERTVELIAERQLPCVAFLMTDRYIDSVPPGTYDGLWLRMLRAKDENDRNLIAAGAKILLANDMGIYGQITKTDPTWAGIASGEDAPRDLGTAHTLWLRAALERGMSPMDALLSATRNIAQAYQRNELGTLEVGKRADLVVLDADPLADPDNYTRIAHVVKDGEFIDRDRLPEQPVLTARREDFERSHA
jgi:imidazolonepropionase-like amidohydrolase